MLKTFTQYESYIVTMTLLIDKHTPSLKGGVMFMTKNDVFYPPERK